MGTTPYSHRRRIPYGLLIGVFSIPIALLILQIGYQAIRVLVQAGNPRFLAGLGEALILTLVVIIASAITNALALWSAKADPSTPYRQMTIGACSISLALSLYPVAAVLLHLPLTLVLWASSS